MSNGAPAPSSLKTESVRARHWKMIFWMMRGSQLLAEAQRSFAEAAKLHESALRMSGDMPTETDMRRIVEEMTGVKQEEPPTGPRLVVPE